MTDLSYDMISDEIGEALVEASQTKVPAVTCTIEGELTEADLAEYCAQVGDLPATKSDEKDLATLRAKHHQVARLLALGLPEGLIAELSGYTAPYISTLKQSPAMIELVSHFRAPGDNATRVMSEKLRLLADMSVEQLIAKIQAGDADINQLLAATKLGADRSNNGPMAKIDHSHTHSLNPEQVAQLAQSARKRNAERIIPIEQVRQSLPAPKQEGDGDG